MMLVLCCIALALAALTSALFCRNLSLYSPLPRLTATPEQAVSVLIPARNEEANIGEALRAILASRDVEWEVIVADDHSDDATAEIVADFARQESRVRLVSVPPLPAGWNGKQHACHWLAQAAKYPLLCFTDADVRLAPDALARISSRMSECDVSLLSGLPTQVTVTAMERLLIPLIHFILLGYLPFDGMRLSNSAAYAAGCGQLFVARREAYRSCGGHSAIRSSLHDGLKLPAVFRRAGYKTDLFDATDMASVRMYNNARQVWDGLAKNATEGMASLGLLPVFTVLLLGGQVLPVLLLVLALLRHQPTFVLLSATSTALAYLPRLLAIGRFRQPFSSALLHPVGVLTLLSVQWYALGRDLLGGTAEWKGRTSGRRVFASGYADPNPTDASPIAFTRMAAKDFKRSE